MNVEGIFRKAHNPFTYVKLINTLVYLHRVLIYLLYNPR
jgi:hypothetical protein